MTLVSSCFALASLSAVIGCLDINFGADTPSARFELTGVVTSAADGQPLEGVEIFLFYTGCGDNPPGFCLIGGAGVTRDTVRTDAAGRYHLSTRYYCPARLLANRPGFEQYRWPSMHCSNGTITRDLNAALTPEQPAS